MDESLPRNKRFTITLRSDDNRTTIRFVTDVDDVAAASLRIIRDALLPRNSYKVRRITED